MDELVKLLQGVVVKLLGLDPKEFGDSVSLGIWLLVGIVSLLTWYSARRYQRKQDGAEAYKDLDQSYLALYQSALDYPTVIDPEKTYHFESLPRDERLRYEAYAYRVWVVCETIYDALGLAKEPTLWDRLHVWPRTTLSWLFGTPSVRPRPFEELLRRNAFIAQSQLSAADWKTWRSALDIEARLHIKWFLAEGRFRESFKDTFKLGVLRRYAGRVLPPAAPDPAVPGKEPVRYLRDEACMRYGVIGIDRLRDEWKPVIERLQPAPAGLRNPTTAGQVEDLLRRWWGTPPSDGQHASTHEGATRR